MRLFSIGTALYVAALAVTGVAAIDESWSAVDALSELQRQAMEGLKVNPPPSRKRGSAKTCSLLTADRRQDWEHMSKFQRKDYIRAVHCLHTLPSKSDPAWAPAARTRYDDFVAVHMNMTMSVHGSGLFLTWHRYLVWAYEQALRNECSYKGYQPYWNYFSHADNIYESPVFDGSDTSMGGDGDFFEHDGALGGASMIKIPSGKGGGCMTTGPFANWTANMGPVRPGMQNMSAIPDFTVYNPRCLRRDLSSYVTSKWFTTANLLNVTIGPASQTHYSYWREVQGRYPDQFLGLHTSGHYAMGADATDLYSSINDPAFYLHHTMFDRLYWIWQVLHPSEARKTAGTLTLSNNPPTRNATVDDLLQMGILAETRPLHEMFDTLGGTPLCYIYV
ncbi:Tyrosinase-like protein orsC [Apiospora kogelbergensis]|uniref:Tyrosinase-like protein orsC n=1 Tax=Apiospora kogelbergensis TaxID=1337665 RepID=A0AAW0QJE6_9PEZI